MPILGIDEVGRGSWAGPLVIGAVILPDFLDIPGLTDSKKLTPKKRELLDKEIRDTALAYALGWVPASELDQIGLAGALKLATRRAVQQIQSTSTSFTKIIIDGTSNFLAGTPLAPHATILKKADLLIKEVSAASIIAKVARDRYMVELAQKYPDFGFDKHVGYGTALHKTAISRYGICAEHRRSFKPIQQLCPTSPTPLTSSLKNTTAIGARAEDVVANFLKNQGHQVIARNHKTKFYEIDIISLKADKIYFTEVKYRRNPQHGAPLTAIDQVKLQKMQFATESFLQFAQSNSTLSSLLVAKSPVLAVASVSGADFHLDDWFALGI